MGRSEAFKRLIININVTCNSGVRESVVRLACRVIRRNIFIIFIKHELPEERSRYYGLAGSLLANAVIGRMLVIRRVR